MNLKSLLIFIMVGCVSALKCNIFLSGSSTIVKVDCPAIGASPPRCHTVTVYDTIAGSCGYEVECSAPSIKCCDTDLCNSAPAPTTSGPSSSRVSALKCNVFASGSTTKTTLECPSIGASPPRCLTVTVNDVSAGSCGYEIACSAANTKCCDTDLCNSGPSSSRVSALKCNVFASGSTTKTTLECPSIGASPPRCLTVTVNDASAGSCGYETACSAANTKCCDTDLCNSSSNLFLASFAVAFAAVVNLF